MNVLVYKDGKLVCTDNPIQGTGNALDNLLMLVSEPQDGDVLKYDAANGIWVAGAESGGGGSGGVLVVHASDQFELDKTWNEINNAFKSNGVVVSVFDGAGFIAVMAVHGEAGEYSVVTFNGSVRSIFYADTPDDYPVMEQG